MVGLMKICLTCPVHIQPTQEWIDALPNIDIIITDDSDGKVKIDRENVRMYNYEKQKEALGEFYEGFEKFHKSSACKNFGHIIAYREGYDIIIGIDSDCICPADIVEKHIEALNMKGGLWENPLYKVDRYPRGYPYWARDKEVVANMGMWNNCLDINGKDRTPDEPKDSLIYENKIAVGIIPFSGMNWSIKREWLPAFFFVPNFGKFRRHDDIFGGYIFQKIVKMADKCISYGLPIVRHDSVVDPEEDAEAESEMNIFDASFYVMIDEAFDRLPNSPYNTPLDILMELEFVSEGNKFKDFIEAFNWYKKLWQK